MSRNAGLSMEDDFKRRSAKGRVSFEEISKKIDEELGGTGGLAAYPSNDDILDEAFEDIERQTRVELLPDGRVVILAMDMAEVSVRTATHGKITVTVEETDREFYRKSHSLSLDHSKLNDLLLKKASEL